LVPGDHVCPLDAMLWLARNGCDCAQGHRRARGVHVKLALYAGGHSGEDDPGLPFEAWRSWSAGGYKRGYRLGGDTFCPAVYQRLVAVLDILIDHVDEGRVDPSTCLDAVQAADDELELHVKALVEILDPVVVRSDLDALHSPLDKPCGHFSLGLAHILLAEEELTVEVGDVDRVHVDDMDILESRESEIFQYLAA